mmetsp:Transcript_22464/g.63203  ORF Transcript_22464/g.63203 Transcript_22464/m.63203 type:complete len:485 (+) Transcript_22464:61-1515(+)
MVAMGKGTSLGDPVTVEQVPDLVASRHDIDEYLNANRAYDMFDFLLKELITRQPADPLQHLLDCLQTPHPTGPLKIVVAGPPGVNRRALAKSIAETFGLEHISAGDLLGEAGVDTADCVMADEERAAKLVVQKVKEVSSKMEGYVLDGFPRTRFQATFLKEESVVPAHVIVLKASAEFIHRQQEEGTFEGKRVSAQVLEQKLHLFSGHTSAALEAYQDRVTFVDAEGHPGDILDEMARVVRKLPRSRGPQPLPRVVLLGPPGVGASEHAARLATRLGAVLVDANDLEVTRFDNPEEGMEPKKSKKQMANEAGFRKLRKLRTCMDLPNQEALQAADPLGIVGVRLRQQDCLTQGFVLTNFPGTEAEALAMQEDARLCPTRVIALDASEELCVKRLRCVQMDPVTGKVWTAVPRNEQVRKRLLRNPRDHPDAVSSAHKKYMASIPGIFKAFGKDGRSMRLPSDGAPEKIFIALADFVERPLPLPEP